MFRGEQLRWLRVLNHLSRHDLGGMLELTEQEIWQYENGLLPPSFKVLMKLCQYFNVRQSYFFKDTLQTSQFSTESIAYRLGNQHAQQTTLTAKVFLSQVAEIISYLESWLVSPKHSVMQLRDEITRFYQLSSTKSYQEIENWAQYARDWMGTFHNEHLLVELEKIGIYILERDLDIRAEAYSTWSLDNQPFIVLGMEKSAVRRNFDLAHELGHLLMHFDIDIHSLNKEEYRRIEQEANIFASCFLLPKCMISTDLERIVDYTNPDQYKNLKTKYYVSIQALAMRAYQLDYMTREQHSIFYRQIHRKKYKLSEPYDLILKFKRPGKIRYLFNLVLSEGLVSIQELERYFAVNFKFFEELFLMDNFFDNYQTTSTRSRTSKKIYYF